MSKPAGEAPFDLLRTGLAAGRSAGTPSRAPLIAADEEVRNPFVILETELIVREFMWRTFAPEPRMRLNLGIRRRLAPLLHGDRRKIELVNSILFSLPGSPIIYYGDEIGMGDNIWLKDRDGVRTPMQWDGGRNAGFSAASPDRLYAPVVDDERFGYRRVNVTAQRADPHSLWHALRRMIAVRKQHRALSWGECELLPLANQTLLSILRTHGDQTILAAHNLSPLPQRAGHDLARWRGARVESLLSDQPFPPVGDGPYEVTLPAYGWVWLKIGPPGSGER